LFTAVLQLLGQWQPITTQLSADIGQQQWNKLKVVRQKLSVVGEFLSFVCIGQY